MNEKRGKPSMYELQKEKSEPVQEKTVRIRQRKNETGLSDQMKESLEQKTGFSADDVRVYRNSPVPAQMGALAISEGSNIHLGPGNDKHLMHELGHWVQKKMGKVKATGMENGIPINDDPALEDEADHFHL